MHYGAVGDGFGVVGDKLKGGRQTPLDTERLHFMLHPLQSGSKTRSLALTSLFAVLYTVLRLVPTFPMIGIAGAFSASDVLAPLYGILLGPFVGGASLVLGTFLAIAFGRPMIFLGLDFLPATVNAVALGLLIRRRFHAVTVIYLVLLGLFLAHPLTLWFVTTPNGLPLPFNWLHFAAFVILLSPLSRRAVSLISASSPRSLAQGLTILCFIGTMMQHLIGGFLFESILGSLLGTIGIDAWPGVWSTIFYIYPLERLALTFVSTVIGSALITALRVSGFGRPVQR